MQEYAITELPILLSRVPKTITVDDIALRYICALLSEVAYYHIPEFEIDDRRRAKLILSRAYQKLLERGIPRDLTRYLKRFDDLRTFVEIDRGVVAVGAKWNDLLFIAFRGR